MPCRLHSGWMLQHQRVYWHTRHRTYRLFKVIHDKTICIELQVCIGFIHRCVGLHARCKDKHVHGLTVFFTGMVSSATRVTLPVALSSPTSATLPFIKKCFIVFKFFIEILVFSARGSQINVVDIDFGFGILGSEVGGML